jgi:hypothetical protein
MGAGGTSPISACDCGFSPFFFLSGIAVPSRAGSASRPVSPANGSHAENPVVSKQSPAASYDIF